MFCSYYSKNVAQTVCSYVLWDRKPGFVPSLFLNVLSKSRFLFLQNCSYKEKVQLGHFFPQNQDTFLKILKKGREDLPLQLRACRLTYEINLFNNNFNDSNKFSTILKCFIELNVTVDSYVSSTPSMEPWNSPCRGEGTYPPRSSNQSTSTRRAKLSVAAKVARSAYLLNHVKT